MATSYPVNDGAITKRLDVAVDPKRDGLLIARAYDSKGFLLATLYGKKNQAAIQERIRRSGK